MNIGVDGLVALKLKNQQQKPVVKVGRTIFLTMQSHSLIAIYFGIGAFKAALLDLGQGVRCTHGRIAMKLKTKEFSSTELL